MSSIGYDFLSFKRPMFFLNEQKRPITDNLYLYRCGKEVKPEEYPHLYEIIQENKNLSYKKEQDAVYTYTFGEDLPLASLKNKLSSLYSGVSSWDLLQF